MAEKGVEEQVLAMERLRLLLCFHYLIIRATCQVNAHELLFFGTKK